MMILGAILQLIAAYAVAMALTAPGDRGADGAGFAIVFALLVALIGVALMAAAVVSP